MDTYSRNEWKTYFDAVAVSLIAKPHTARRRARDMAKLCPYADVAAAGLARVKAAIEAHTATAAAVNAAVSIPIKVAVMMP